MESLAELVAMMGGWSEISSAAILTFVVFMILRGELIPSKTNQFLISERDAWKKVAEENQRITQVQTQTVATLMETATTMDKVIRSLPTPEEEEKSNHADLQE